MRLRTSTSGPDSPPMGDNIQVARSTPDGTEEPRRKRIKLKFTTSSVERLPAPAVSRPKRTSAGRVKYADNLTDVALSSLPIPPADRLKSSSSASFLSSPPGSDISTDQNAHAGYGADFLANYIEDDTTPTPGAARLKDKLSGSGRRSTASPRLTLKPPKQIITISSDDVLAEKLTLRAAPQHIDPPPVIIRKLVTACQALDSLGISAGPYPTDLPPLTHGQDTAREGGLGVVASSSPSSAKRAAPIFAGEVDEDMMLLVRDTINVLNNYLSTCPSSKLLQSKQPGMLEQGQPHERHAVKALGDLLEGGVLYVNCRISSERMHLMFRLYRQLGSMMYGPRHQVQAQLPPMPAMHAMQVPMWSPQVAAGYTGAPGPAVYGPASGTTQTIQRSPHQFMHHPSIAAQHQTMSQESPSKPQAQGPAPHQFLFRETEQGKAAPYESPYSNEAKLAAAHAMPLLGPHHLQSRGQGMNPHHQQMLYDPRAQALIPPAYAQTMMSMPVGTSMGAPQFQPVASRRKRTSISNGKPNAVMPGYTTMAPPTSIPGSAYAPEG